jgi:Tfp pilus assembly protein FimT
MSRVGTSRNDGRSQRLGNCSGFSVLELMVVVAIIFIIAGFAVPKFLTMIHTAKLRGCASDFSGLVQAARINAVQDARFYSVYILGNEGFVDIWPKSNTGASGSGGTQIDNRDPLIAIPSEVTSVAAGNAPNTPSLSARFLPAGSGLTPKDGGPGAGTPITFGPRGLPCTSQTATGGTVCDSAGGATAFWIFFRNRISGELQAVTVSPAGRIRKWYYDGTAWFGI